VELSVGLGSIRSRAVRVSLGMVVTTPDGRRFDLGTFSGVFRWEACKAQRRFGLRGARGMATLQVNTGRAIVTGRLLGVAQAVPSFGAWGTGAGVTAATDTTLFAEDVTAGYARIAGTMSQATTTTANDTEQIVWTITAKANLTITNAGIFDALTAGNLYMKGDFASQVLNQNDSITFTAKVSYT
jgi:hypothetical protein